METTEFFELNVIQILWGKKTQGILHYKGFSNNKGVDFISLGLADTFLRIEEVMIGLSTHFEIFADKEANKGGIVACRWLKTNDDAGLVKRGQFRKQQIEAIMVIRELERLNDYFANGGESSSEMVEFGNINA